MSLTDHDAGFETDNPEALPLVGPPSLGQRQRCGQPEPL